MSIKDHCIAVGLIVWNGEKTIRYSLESILKQTHKNLIVYILDNQSTDSTQRIIQDITEVDNRVRLIVDSQNRNVADAQRYIFENYMIQSEFCMFACDDDFYEPSFIRVVLDKLINENLDLVYTSHYSIDSVTNRKTYVKSSLVYSLFHSSFINSCRFLLFRNCVPIFFGIYKTNSLSSSMRHFKLFDSSGFNHENLMLFDFLLKSKVGFIYDALFGYLSKERIELYRKRGYLFSRNDVLYMPLIFIHQFNFSRQIYQIVVSNNLNYYKKLFLFFIIVLAYPKYTILVIIRALPIKIYSSVSFFLKKLNFHFGAS